MALHAVRRKARISKPFNFVIDVDVHETTEFKFQNKNVIGDLKLDCYDTGCNTIKENKQLVRSALSTFDRQVDGVTYHSDTTKCGRLLSATLWGLASAKALAEQLGYATNLKWPLLVSSSATLAFSCPGNCPGYDRDDEEGEGSQWHPSASQRQL